ncbi:MAG: serine--tRNA ligase [Leuconostoc gelidum]|jgi:seryl-tRNA synthetase|uniref:serine--tRNA ligase n=1 Tax=Leuconostoc gelidum TaxID=1244 RepID=UPI0015760BFE|nr:serine--tRNA ligase [Leuconostoc gelidum]MBZ5978829.1 serine--tRNA ligase [Leuconostoc gelidum subsp. gelidum]MBZ6002184.1 serine--tRNA ligase [Leuconostoc gelidum subsp. gelidum]QDJ29294.1 serine--tRNA ligase [Leuconostoc gelidum subsp. gelidum]
MLDMKYLRKNVTEVTQKLQDRGVSPDNLIELLNLDQERRDTIQKVENLKADRNIESDKIAYAKRNQEDASQSILAMQRVSQEIKKLDARQLELNDQVQNLAAHLPNLAASEVPVGVDESANIEQRVWEPTDYQKRPHARLETPKWLKAHYEVGEALGILDFERGAKVSGARFLYYVGDGARLERAVYNFMLDEHRKEGYTEMITPIVVNDAAMFGTGQYPKFQDDAYRVSGLAQTYIPTAEVPLTNYYSGETLPADDLPIKFTALSPSFRKEAGAAGKDTRGLIRLHQFNKVEMVKFTKPDQSYAELESMTANAESILQKLGLPYHVIMLSTGDMGFSAAKTYDIEVWMPQQSLYREISSVSNTEAFQARRMHITYRDEDNKLQLVHTLNGSGLAVGRTVAAILENYQNEDGSITIPEILRSYMGGQEKLVATPHY